VGRHRDLFPSIEPYQTGMVDVGDNHIHWEACGNLNGKPALAIHGGPGSGCVPCMRRPFNPDIYRIVLLYQRGCGRSTPHASDPAVDLSTNTTDHLIADIELLREHLGVNRWVIAGWSWGTTLALAYAQAHPACVTAMALAAVTTTSPSDVAWITRYVGRLFPAAWARFRDALPAADRDGSVGQLSGVAAVFDSVVFQDLAALHPAHGRGHRRGRPLVRSERRPRRRGIEIAPNCTFSRDLMRADRFHESQRSSIVAQGLPSSVRPG
jgi:proline iminopeptidase